MTKQFINPKAPPESGSYIAFQIFDEGRKTLPQSKTDCKCHLIWSCDTGLVRDTRSSHQRVRSTLFSGSYSKERFNVIFLRLYSWVTTVTVIATSTVVSYIVTHDLVFNKLVRHNSYKMFINKPSIQWEYKVSITSTYRIHFNAKDGIHREHYICKTAGRRRFDQCSNELSLFG